MNSQHTTQQIEQWGTFDFSIDGPMDGNPFVDVSFGANFRLGHRVVSVTGFYEGNGRYRVRFMPDADGKWEVETYSNRSELSGHGTAFDCLPPADGNHGPVRVAKTWHFEYADGSPHRPIGTTCYAWIHQTEDLRNRTLDTLSKSPFNKIRMCVFPKSYTYNENEPEHYPFERDGDRWDFSRPNPAFFSHLEKCVRDLMDIGVEADIILFHPYDRWGFAKMTPAQDEMYLRYVVARLAAYRNVWWSMANEYDLMIKPVPLWDRLFQVVQECDHAQHPRSIHNWQGLETHDWRTFYDHGKPWVTHCSIQHGDVDQCSNWREQYRKPCVLDEVCYEGDLPNGWGNLTAAELVRRFWVGAVSGGYVGHGETYLRPDDEIWWSKGGSLIGDSPARIAFLARVLEEGPVEGLNPAGRVTNTHMAAAGKPGQYYLTYFGHHQPAEVRLTIPEGESYHADVIDTWDMTFSTASPAAVNGTRIRLPRKPYIALRLTRVTG